MRAEDDRGRMKIAAINVKEVNVHALFTYMVRSSKVFYDFDFLSKYRSRELLNPLCGKRV